MNDFCKRCGREAPTEYFAEKWARPFDIGGILCPRCYGGLQRLRKKARDQWKRDVGKWMRGKK